MNILVVGLGYVGLPLALGLSKKFDNVLGYEIDEIRLQLLNEGKSPVDTVTDHELSNSNLVFTGEIYPDKAQDIVFICVPTPLDNLGNPDTSIIDDAVEKLCQQVSEHAVFVNVSTVAPGFTDSLFEKHARENYGFAPEREDPGNKDYNLLNTSRVYSASNDYSLSQIQKVFERLGVNGHIASSVKVAETTKILENTHRLVNIAFMNEFQRICDQLGMSIQEINDLAATKPYGYTKFSSGIGIGGHCIPVDPVYLKTACNILGVETT